MGDCKMTTNTQLTQNEAATLLEFASLQMASEALYDLQNDIPNGISHNKTGNLIELDYLTGGNKHASKFTKTQAEEFMGNWEIVSHLPNTATGFSGTLFKAKKANTDAGISEGDLVISFRSTEFIDDAVRDNRATNTFEIKEKGWAFGQISDMKKWFESLRNQEPSLIPEGKQISVTGYSLGGHLATTL